MSEAIPATEPTPRVTSYQRAQADAARTGGTLYYDELLYRGQPNGQPGGAFKAMQAIVGLQYVDTFGDVQVRTYDPCPVGELPGDIPFPAIFEAAAVAMAKKIDEQIVTIAERDAQLLAAAVQSTADAVTIADLTAQLAQVNARIAAAAAALSPA